VSIEYVIGYDCKVKEAVGGGEDFVRSCTWRLLARTAKREARRKGLRFSEVEITHRFVTLDGVEGAVEPLSNLLDEAKKLEELTGPCADCPACVLEEILGCFGTLAYPLSAEAEAWLHDRITVEVEPWAARGWRNFWKENRADPARIALLRSKGDDFLEGKNAWGLTTLSGGRPLTLNANELLAALFAAGSLKPTDGLMLLGLLGALDPEVDPEDEERPVVGVSEMEEVGGPEETLAFDVYPEPYDDPSTCDLKAYLFSIFFAAALGVELQVSL
jgi:hypothetical protein